MVPFNHWRILRYRQCEKASTTSAAGGDRWSGRVANAGIHHADHTCYDRFAEGYVAAAAARWWASVSAALT